MNLSSTASALPAALTQTGTSPSTGSNDMPDTDQFSQVLGRQSGRSAAAAGTNGQASARSGQSKDEDDPNLVAEAGAMAVQAGGEQRISDIAPSLPQIALYIASEVAQVRGMSNARGAAANDASLSTALRARPNAEHPHSTDASALMTKPGASGVTTRAVSNDGIIDNMTAGLPALSTLESKLNSTPPQAAALAQLTDGAKLDHAQAALQRSDINLKGVHQAVLLRQARMEAQPQAADAARAATRVATAWAPVSGVADPISNLHHADSASQSNETLAWAAGSSAAFPTAQANGGTGGPLSFGLPGVVSTQLSSPQWAQDFSQQFIRIAQAAANTPQTAELRLDPPELGPLRITLSLNDNVAHAAFVSAHASVRQTVENALPQLQQALAQAGISLGHTSVSDQGHQQASFSESHGQGNSGERGAQSGGPQGNGVDGATGTNGASPRSRHVDALVDTFA